MRIKSIDNKHLGNFLIQTVAILAALFPMMVPAQEMGILFTEPEEREYLDFLRNEFVQDSQLATFDIDEDIIPDIPIAEEEQAAAEEIISYKFGGIMVRLNGSRMIWLNENQIAESDLPGNMTLVETLTSTLLNIRANGTSYQLKPGQTINLNQGIIYDAYQLSADDDFEPGTEPGTEEADTSEVTIEQDVIEETVLAVTETTSEPEAQTELGAILDQINPDGGEFTDEQLQQALDMLTAQESPE